jgi:hypothetical protein
MALTRVNASTAISGTIAASSVANATVANISSLPASIPTGALTLLSTQTASSSASISFTSGIDSTYDSYVFKFIDIHPSVLNGRFSFNASIDGGSNYNVIKTTTSFRAYHAESDSETSLSYNTAQDLAQSTSDQQITPNLSNNNDGSASGYLQLFNPSSTTYVKHFISQTNSDNNAYSYESFIAGYCNTTSAINAITFKMNTGNIDDGIIKMYGVK